MAHHLVNFSASLPLISTKRWTLEHTPHTIKKLASWLLDRIQQNVYLIMYGFGQCTRTHKWSDSLFGLVSSPTYNGPEVWGENAHGSYLPQNDLAVWMLSIFLLHCGATNIHHLTQAHQVQQVYKVHQEHEVKYPESYVYTYTLGVRDLIDYGD